MRVLVLGGTTFVGRRLVERLHARGDDVMVVHRGETEPAGWVPVEHLHTDRADLTSHAADVRAFGPDAVLDSRALTRADVAAVLGVLPDVPAVVLSSMDVYEAFEALRTEGAPRPVPLTEESPVRVDRYPYRGQGGAGDDYDKLDVEEAWAPRGACVLRLPLVYGPFDAQRREEPLLRRVRVRRAHVPVGGGTLLLSRVHVDDVATGVLVALDRPAAHGRTLNLAEPTVVPGGVWAQQVLDTAAEVSGHRVGPVQVPDHLVPDELWLTGTQAQHVVADVSAAREVLGWAPGDPGERVAGSVRWHLEHPPATPWTEADSAADDAAVAARGGGRPAAS